ncbi:MAG: Imm49 family immunity protein [Chloroflexota bacterium]
MHIPMHTFPIDEKHQIVDYATRRIPNKYAQYLDLDRGSNYTLRTLYTFALEYIIYSLLHQLEDNQKECIAATQLLIQSDTLQYLSLFDPSIPDYSYIGNQRVVVHKDNDSSPISLFYWQIICQSERIRNILLDNDYHPFLATRGPVSDYRHAHYEFLLLMLWHRWDEALRYLSTVDIAYEKQAPWYRKVANLYPDFHWPLWRAFLTNKEEDFNDTLVDCLKQFRKYWSSTSFRSNAIEGHFALEITAIIKLAMLRGYTIPTTSDYTPTFFTDPSFQLDIDTRLSWYFTPKKINSAPPLDLEKLVQENRKRNQEKKK